MSFQLTNTLGQLLVFLAFLLSGSKAQETCTLPNTLPGSCVPMNSCPLIRNALRQRPIPAGLSNYLRNVHCGPVTESRVCCQSPDVTQPSPPTTASSNDVVPTSPVDVTNHPNARLLPSDICGPLWTEKLSGGNETVLFEFPWMALLQYDTTEGLRYGCGGSIINDRYILTAAHCMRSPVNAVFLGEWNTDTALDCQTIGVDRTCAPPREEYQVEEVIVHPRYNRPRHSNDIALLRLNRRISFAEDHIKPVCLPSNWRLQNEPITSLILSGWGATENSIQSNLLLKVRLDKADLSECQEKYKNVELSNNQICAKGLGIIDACKGDSGGPLVYPSRLALTTVQYVQYGIVVAGGDGCGFGDEKPGIYLRVQNYMHWILDNIRN